MIVWKKFLLDVFCLYQSGFIKAISAIWSQIIRVILKSREFHLESQVWFQTKLAQQEVQLPLYYSHFEIAEFSQYQYFIDQLAGLLKSENKKAFTSHFVFEAEVMRYRAKIVRFKTEMMRFRTWMTRFRTDVI